MNQHGDQILANLRAVDAERQRRADDAGLGQRVEQVKHFQQARFERTYADLLAQPAYSAVTRFFLDELYGPHDFTARDAQFARIVPALERLFAAEIIGTVGLLGELHALSERLDSRMAEAIEPGPLDAQAYAQAWRTVGEPALRNRQVDLSLQVGAALKRYTRNPLLRHTLRMMRAPAQAAGLGALQRFLEAGFDTFRGLRDPEAFLDTLGRRENALAAALFEGRPVPDLGDTPAPP